MRGARSLALRHANAYISNIEGQFFGDASNFMVGGMGDVSDASLFEGSGAF
jgi:hypothetical protein